MQPTVRRSAWPSRLLRCLSTVSGVPTTAFGSGHLLSRPPHLFSLLQSCSCLDAFNQVLAQVFTYGLSGDPFTLARALSSLCSLSPSSDLRYARLLFEHTETPNAFSWNTIIRAYSVHPLHHQECFFLFIRMLLSGVYPDKYTFPFVLRACSAAAFSAQASDEGGSEWLSAARRLFDEMPERSTVTWNAMTSCHVKCKCEVQGLVLFNKMLVSRVEPNEATLVNVLMACAATGARRYGKCLHAYVQRKYMWMANVDLGTSLIHMYMKCGDICSALLVFRSMVVKDVPAWTAAIGGLALQGRGSEAIAVFDRMVYSDVKPDAVTFTSLLHACSHSGLVGEGLRFFNLMVDVYGIKPGIQHYCCIVDLLGRSGLLLEALKVIRSMPYEPNAAIWYTILSSCAIHGDFELAERIAYQVQTGREVTDGAYYVLLSNMYAKLGNWKQVTKMRDMMVDSKANKVAGYSMIEVNGSVNTFLVGDDTHELTLEIYSLLHGISQELKLAGHVSFAVVVNH
ncbi:pentatricopeptide repeat-containing protein At2g02980, chloroplastic-like [Nymphaea colorata]|uniref:pentatricopeptide repeat-containing protein At2g02980, chloroplastic-like n=1 Tax=Nymphaea colorata TaxID=210225 RepID=UPI00214EC1AA|nr:pentatricopeptide repeat-containing protein At2g02980, chloroplastic-like [Nymphaea colorata]